jgi:murein peptide amidase A
LRGRPLALGLCLHEDYDGLGTYVYELSPDKTAALAEAALTASEAIVPRDLRKSIDGHSAKRGIIRRDEVPPEVVGPEAIILRRDFGCSVTLTIETPSEFALEARALAQRLCVAAALEHYQAHG